VSTFDYQIDRAERLVETKRHTAANARQPIAD
jgi:hypothetical protein